MRCSALRLAPPPPLVANLDGACACVHGHFAGVEAGAALTVALRHVLRVDGIVFRSIELHRHFGSESLSRSALFACCASHQLKVPPGQASPPWSCGPGTHGFTRSLCVMELPRRRRTRGDITQSITRLNLYTRLRASPTWSPGPRVLFHVRSSWNNCRAGCYTTRDVLLPREGGQRLNGLGTCLHALSVLSATAAGQAPVACMPLEILIKL